MITLYGGYYYGYGFDPMYILILISAAVALVAQVMVSATFGRYSKAVCRAGVTGEQAARKILQSQGIYDVLVEPVAGNLTDHYDPRHKVLRLSDSVYYAASVAAVSVAAHECGHAIQHAHGYVPLKLRTAIVPLAQFGSYASWFFIMGGLFFGSMSFLLDIGILIFSFAVLFQVVTLPVEFNASSRAMVLLKENGILYDSEVRDGKKVLGAAAMTYVAAAATAILQLIRLIALFGGRNRD